MIKFNLCFLLSLILIFSSLHLLNAQATDKPWWPNVQWGPGDQAGASNWITSEKILKAISLVKTGKMYELGNIYEQNMPLSGNRSYKLVIPSFPTHIAPDNVVFNDEYVTGELGQVGTQFDGLGHPGKVMKLGDGTITEVFYNGFTKKDMMDAYGLKKLGIEQIKPIITRGLLIDLVGLKGVPTVPDGFELSLADVKAALSKQGISESWIEPGDALLFNFGWWRNWPNKWVMDGARRPKISKEVVQWLIDKKPSMVGSDAILDGEIFNVHTELTMKQGVFNLEWMNFQNISEDKAYQFLFIFTPLRLKGATGSPGRPLAIR
jgi:kynurenine formamidase